MRERVDAPSVAFSLWLLWCPGSADNFGGEHGLIIRVRWCRGKASDRGDDLSRQILKRNDGGCGTNGGESILAKKLLIRVHRFGHSIGVANNSLPRGKL